MTNAGVGKDSISLAEHRSVKNICRCTDSRCFVTEEDKRVDWLRKMWCFELPETSEAKQNFQE